MPDAPRFPAVLVPDGPAGDPAIVAGPSGRPVFLGPAARGPRQPTLVASLAEAAQGYGPPQAAQPLSEALRDYFLQAEGAGPAWVMRLYRKPAGATRPACALLRCGALRLRAAEPGAWGGALQLRIDHAVTPAEAAAARRPPEELFNLQVRDGTDGRVERFRGLSPWAGPRRVDRVLAAQSRLLRAARPAAGTPRPPAHAEPRADRSPWDDPAAHTGVAPGETGHDSAPLRAADWAAAVAALDALPPGAFDLMVLLPPAPGAAVPAAARAAALAQAVSRAAVLLVDAPPGWQPPAAGQEAAALVALGIEPARAGQAALYLPGLRGPDGAVRTPCAAVAGLIARTDRRHGPWRAPAGREARLHGLDSLEPLPAGATPDALIAAGFNPLRSGLQDDGLRVGGARTLAGGPQGDPEQRHLPVVRLRLGVGTSLRAGLGWVGMEPAGPALEARIRAVVEAFLHGLWRQGALQGASAREAYFARCGPDTTPAADRAAGRLRLLVGLAALRPAEFLLLRIELLAQPAA